MNVDGVTIDEPDAIVVGSGAGGGTAARILTDRGWSVVVMEKGGYWTAEDFLPFDELHFHTHKALIPHRNDDPNIYMSGPAQDQRTATERWWNINMVGGSTMVWDANMPRYTREDFEVLDYLPEVPSDASMVNWPWTYDEFQPWFEKAEREWGVSGRANQCEVQEPTRPGYEYPMPPLRLHASTDFLMAAFGKAGMTPYLGPRAINTQTYDGRPACSFCGYNQFFGCAVNSRASSANTVLPRALASGRCDLRTGHCVTRLVHEDGRVKGVMYKTEPDGPEKFLGASRVFVSIQTIESARLFLLSEVPDPNGLIGRYLTYHTHGNVEMTLPDQPVWDLGPQYQPRTALGSLQVRDLYVIDDPGTHLTKGGKFSVYDPYTWATPIRLLKGAAMGPGKPSVWGTDLRDYVEELRSQGGVYFSFTGEAMSVYDNRVEVDDQVKDPWGMPVARTYYRHHPYDLDLSRYCLDRVSEVMADAGAEVRKLVYQAEENPGYGHVQGSLRAGADPGGSVLDADCQSHTVEGLYVLDCAWMPTAGASNPTMTLLANAYRVCERVPDPD
jgi:choline dehydrogenase-like flavoprotein